jgi:hypothetical protein
MMAQREGYLMIDHRASPGIPEDVAVRIGMDPKQVAEGKLFETATLTCCHCKGTVLRNVWRTRPRYDCPKCGHKYLCDGCAAATRMPDYDHTPFEKLVDDTLNAAAKGMVLGSPPGLLTSK